MYNLTKSFKITLTLLICLIIVGVVFSFVFGANTFATLGNGQQLIYSVEHKENGDYSAEISEAKHFLKGQKASIITVQKRFDANDKTNALLFTFKADKDINESVTIGDKVCAVTKINSAPAVREVVRGAIASAVVLAVLFAYLALRFIKNNWLAHSIGFLATALINVCAMYGIVQILGIVGYQYDSNIMAAVIYTIMATALLFVIFTSSSKNYAAIKNVSLSQAVEPSLKNIFCLTSIVFGLIALFCIALMGIMGNGFIIVLMPVLIATIVTFASGFFVAPYLFRTLLKNQPNRQKTENQ